MGRGGDLLCKAPQIRRNQKKMKYFLFIFLLFVGFLTHNPQFPTALPRFSSSLGPQYKKKREKKFGSFGI